MPLPTPMLPAPTTPAAVEAQADRMAPTSAPHLPGYVARHAREESFRNEAREWVKHTIHPMKRAECVSSDWPLYACQIVSPDGQRIVGYGQTEREARLEAGRATSRYYEGLRALVVEAVA